MPLQIVSTSSVYRLAGTQRIFLSQQQPQQALCSLRQQLLHSQQQGSRCAVRLHAVNPEAPSAAAIENLRVENELLKQTIADTESSIAELEAGESEIRVKEEVYHKKFNNMWKHTHPFCPEQQILVTHETKTRMIS